MYNPQPENINLPSTAADTRSILNSQLQKQSEFMCQMCFRDSI